MIEAPNCVRFSFAPKILQIQDCPVDLSLSWNIPKPIVPTGRRKFRSQTSDNMDRWKAEMGRVREEKKKKKGREGKGKRKRKRREEKKRRRRSKKSKSQKKEDPGARKGKKGSKHCLFAMICGSGGSKSRLAKAAGAEPAGQMRDEKLHAVVVRSTFRSQSQNVKNTTCSDHFWKLRCRKSARSCGAKHTSKSKV